MTRDEGSLVLIGAHADDIELHAGGFAARESEAGRPVHFVMVTNNMSGNLLPDGNPNKPPHRMPPAPTREIRHREQRNAAEVIGAAVHFLDYPQRHYWDGREAVSLSFTEQNHDPLPASSAKPPIIIAAQDPDAINEMGELLVALKPRVIVTQTITDVDPEHHAVASLVWQAYRLKAMALSGVQLLFWAPGTTSYAGMLPQHFDHFVPLNNTQFECKMRMLRCHASQMTNRRLEMVECRARHWGAELGVTFAEPFTTVFNGLERSVGDAAEPG